MPAFEYKVVPAPLKGIKSKGARGTDARFAAALMEAMNEMGKDGWEYQRSETLPCESRSAMGKKSTQFLNMLVFRRETTVEDDQETQTTLEVELPATPVLRRVTTSVPVEEDVTTDVIEETQASDDDVPNEPKAKIAE